MMIPTHNCRAFNVSGTGVAPGGKFALASIALGDVAGFPLVSDEVECPDFGLYLVTFHLFISSSSGSGDIQLRVNLRRGGTVPFSGMCTRHGTGTSIHVPVSASRIIQISNPFPSGAEKLSLESDSGNAGNLTVFTQGTLSIVRLK